MQIHITNLNNMAGTVTIAQSGVTRVAQGMGFKPLDISFYHLEPNFERELGHRLKGLFAAVNPGDPVIFQYPSWIGLNYDECFIDYVKDCYNSKLIIFVQDLQQMIFGSERWVLEWEIRNINKADLLIMPSKKIHRFLIENGLDKNIPVEYQTIWEMPGEVCYTEHKNIKRLIFTGSMERFPFTANYHGVTPIELFHSDKPNREDDASFRYRGYLDTDELMKEIAIGGFGLVWADDEYFENYYSMNQPHKLGSTLSCGIPVVVRKGCAHEEFVTKNGVGFAVDSLEEADAIIQALTDDEFAEIYKNVAAIQMLLLNGAYTRKVLQDSVIRMLEGGNVKNNEPDIIKVINNEESLKYILEHKCSVARFGDGEFDIMTGNSIPYQEYNEQLAEELKTIVGTQSDENLLVCMPDVFEHLERYNEFCINFWTSHLSVNMPVYRKLCKAGWYGSTNLSRPYMDLADKSSAGDYFEHLRKLWENRDVLIVEGSTSRSGVGNDLFDDAKSVIRIIGPSKDAYSMLGALENEIRNYGRDKLILLMLGPTAKVISYHLSQEGYWLVDMGHIDSEYEWYKQGATSKVKLANKHTAEHNFDENIVFDNDEKYLKQIVSKVDFRRK